MAIVVMVSGFAVVFSTANSVDPAPLLMLLRDVIENVLVGKYDEAVALSSMALNVSLPPDLYYIHKKVYRDLINLAMLLKDVDKFVEAGSIDYQNAYRLANELTINKLVIGDDLRQYINKLQSYFIDKQTANAIQKTVMAYVETLLSKVDAATYSVVQLYIAKLSKVNLVVEHPSTVYGGEKLNATLLLKSTTLSGYANISITLIIGEGAIRRINFSTYASQRINLSIETPTAEELLSQGIASYTNVSVRMLIACSITNGSEALYGFALSNFTILFEYPKISIEMPKTVNTSHVEVTINVNTVYGLNASIYIDSVSEKTMIQKIFLEPGVNTIELYVGNLSTGRHRLVLVTYPRGRYLGLATGYDFTIPSSKQSILVLVNLNPVMLYPITTPVIEVHTNASTPYTLVMKLNGVEINRLNNVSASNIRISFELSPPILVAGYSLRIEVEQLYPYSLTEFVEKHVYVLNIVTFATIFIAVLVAVGIAKARNISIAFEIHIPGMRRRNRKSHKQNREVGVRFRESKLVNLYRKLLEILSNLVDPPRKSETLREFLARVDKTLTGIVKELVRKFIMLYERDLYSLHNVDVRESEDIVKRIEKATRNVKS